MYNAYLEVEKREKELHSLDQLQGVVGWGEAFRLSATGAPDRVCAVEVETGRQITYGLLNALSDDVAAWAAGLESADRIAINYENSCDFLVAAIGLAKAGVPAVLLNPGEPARILEERLRELDIKYVLGGPVGGALSMTIEDLPRDTSGIVLRRLHGPEDPCWIIFTSGTTGRSKGAFFNHRRMIGAGIAWSVRCQLTQDSRVYCALPLCHGNGLAVCFSAVVRAHATIILRRRFSVSSFRTDIRNFQCTAMVYIGEIWRYLATLPEEEGDRGLPLTTIFGNGLSQDLWEPTVTRFGLTSVVEHYGATEMPGGALTNWTNRPGYCGFVPPNHSHAQEYVLVNESLTAVADGVAGELLIRVPAERGWRGYTDPSHDAPKLVHGVQTPGDLWWRSGDILVRQADGYFQFVERRGDGFRWKGENVAAADVESALYKTGLVDEASVVGVSVPGHDGQAGLASVISHLTADELAARLGVLLCSYLPGYAVPRFLVVRAERHATTSTLKIRKNDIQKAGLNYLKEGCSFLWSESEYQEIKNNSFAMILDGKLIVR